MITRVDKVIIGKKVNIAEPNALAIGDITVVDQNMKAATSPADASALYIGVCTGKQEVTKKDGSVAEVSIMKYSDRIQKESKPSYVAHAYEAPVAAKIEINFANAAIAYGHRYVLRVLYKDIEVANFQFTHTYEHVAESDNVEDLINAFMKKINNHANRRVSVSKDTNKLIMTAKAKDYDNAIDSLDEYSIVSMDASLYVTLPGELLANQPEAVPGVVITKTEGNPGKGFWKQVRDLEVRNMGYNGIVKTGAYPSIEQDRMVTKDATYNYVTAEWDNLYLSPDNQYIKTTPLRANIFCEGATTALTNALDAFMGIAAGA